MSARCCHTVAIVRIGGALNLKRETSLYLDLVRFTAALAVFLCHVSGQRLTGGFLWQFATYGNDAVALFFVLSGFVIGYVTETREANALTYTVNRAARMYSVALPAIAVTFVLDSIGQTIRPDLYSISWGFVGDSQLQQALQSMTFTNQIWFLNVVPGSDLPYWSLGYEVWYYIVFGLAFFSPPAWRWLAAATALLIAGPRIAALLGLWLIGLGSYHLCARDLISKRLGRILFVGSLAIWTCYEIWAWQNNRPLENFAGRYPQSYLVGTLFAANLLGFSALGKELGAPLRWLAKPIRTVASVTFTLYLFHFPLAQFLRVLSPWPAGSWQGRILVMGGTLALVFAIARVTEDKKDVWRSGLLALAARLNPALAPDPAGLQRAAAVIAKPTQAPQ